MALVREWISMVLLVATHFSSGFSMSSVIEEPVPSFVDADLSKHRDKQRSVVDKHKAG
jgi:hypothetical protein